jgi:hypothetical protein
VQLEDFLKAVRECPDIYADFTGPSGSTRKIHFLTAEYGITDNWPILLNTDFGGFVDSLEKDEFFKGKYALTDRRKETIDSRVYEDAGFDYVPGTVIIRIVHKERQKAFNVEMMLHPYQGEDDIPGKRVPDRDWHIVIADVATDIANFAMKNNIPISFPMSVGWKYRNTEASSRVVYWP